MAWFRKEKKPRQPVRERLDNRGDPWRGVMRVGTPLRLLQHRFDDLFAGRGDTRSLVLYVHGPSAHLAGQATQVVRISADPDNVEAEFAIIVRPEVGGVAPVVEGTTVTMPPLVVDVADLSLTALPFRPPAAEIRGLQGRIISEGDIFVLDTTALDARRVGSGEPGGLGQDQPRTVADDALAEGNVPPAGCGPAAA
mgnify:CR=1 FL=1